MEFKTGNYQTRFICDSDAKLDIQVTRATEKTVWFIDPFDKTKTKRAKIIRRYGQVFFYPTGQYSMAPTINIEDRV